MGSPVIIRKTTMSEIDAKLNLVISDARTPDALKDVVGDFKDFVSGGWIIKNYMKNPIALFNSNADFPIGTIEGVRWKDGQLLGRLSLAPEGTSARHDEIRKLIQCRVLKGIACGFRPIESVPLKSGGRHFLKQELVEVSVCAFGCHPDALLQAKAMGVSTETIRMIFKAQNKVKHYTKEERATIDRRAREKLKQMLKQINPEHYDTEADFVKDCVLDLMANHNHDRGRAEQKCHTIWAERDHGSDHSALEALESKIRKAEAALAKAKSKPLNKTATIAERMEHEGLIARDNNQLRSLRRAREVLTRPREEITWRGKKIPLGHHEEREPGHRWGKEPHRWDRKWQWGDK
jgi:hypothetical protein